VCDVVILEVPGSRRPVNRTPSPVKVTALRRSSAIAMAPRQSSNATTTGSNGSATLNRAAPSTSTLPAKSPGRLRLPNRRAWRSAPTTSSGTCGAISPVSTDPRTACSQPRSEARARQTMPLRSRSSGLLRAPPAAFAQPWLVRRLQRRCRQSTAVGDVRSSIRIGQPDPTVSRLGARDRADSSAGWRTAPARW
jgi:hypothetical protein